MDECRHGMNPEWCATCLGTDSTTTAGDTYGYYGGQTKQDLLDELCDALGIPREPVGRGSSLPSHVFDVAADRTGVARGSMPSIGRAVADKAGLTWTADCDSTGSLSGGGSTVTAAGLRILISAVGRLVQG